MKRLLLLLVLLFMGNNVFCQISPNIKNGLTLRTFGIPDNGFGVNYERRIDTGNNWVVAGVQLFETSSAPNVTNPHLKGFGVELQHRKYIGYDNFYVLYGMVYQEFKVNYSSVGWHKVIIDGMEYYRHDRFSLHQKIIRTGADVLFGYNALLHEGNDICILLDFMIGLGYRQSDVSDSLPGHIDLTQKMTKAGYTGVIIPGGIKIGILF